MAILDPPKFAHSKGGIEKASRGYKDLNRLALLLLRPGGLLATFSCSGQISSDLFQKILFAASVDAGRQVQIINPLNQAGRSPNPLNFSGICLSKGYVMPRLVKIPVSAAAKAQKQKRPWTPQLPMNV